MRRLTKKITSIVLLASFTASLSSMALAADVGTVTDDCVRLRRKASTSSDSLGMLVKGDKVSILDQEDNGWLRSPTPTVKAPTPAMSPVSLSRPTLQRRQTARRIPGILIPVPVI